MKITYQHVEPETEEDKIEQKRRVQNAFELLFELVLSSSGWKQHKANKKKS